MLTIHYSSRKVESLHIPKNTIWEKKNNTKRKTKSHKTALSFRQPLLFSHFTAFFFCLTFSLRSSFEQRLYDICWTFAQSNASIFRTKAVTLFNINKRCWISESFSRSLILSFLNVQRELLFSWIIFTFRCWSTLQNSIQ